MPFILRAVNLLGINSVYAPTLLRLEAWERLARDIEPAVLESLTRVIGLEEVLGHARQMVGGRGRGRTVVDPRPAARWGGGEASEEFLGTYER